MPHNNLYSTAPLVLMLFRPKGNYPLADLPMPAGTNDGDVLPVTKIYLKFKISLATIKAKLTALRKHFVSVPEEMQAIELFIGRVLSNKEVVNFLEGCPQHIIEQATKGLSEGQSGAILEHCMEIKNRLAIIKGPSAPERPEALDSGLSVTHPGSNTTRNV